MLGHAETGSAVEQLLNHPEVQNVLHRRDKIIMRNAFRDWLWFAAGVVIAGSVGAWTIHIVTATCHV